MKCRNHWSARRLLSLCSLSVLLSVSAAACAQDVWVPSGETKCQLKGWATDTNPSGLSVRAAPSATARVLGTLPPYLQTTKEGYAFGVRLSITGSRDGWVRIADARDDPSYTGAAERPTYKGSGWIAGTAVRFAVQSGLGYARADAGSPKIVDLAGDWLTEMGTIDRVLACSGEWALLEFTLHSKRDPQTEALNEIPSDARRKQRAWFRRICGVQETTCEGVTD